MISYLFYACTGGKESITREWGACMAVARVPRAYLGLGRPQAEVKRPETFMA